MDPVSSTKISTISANEIFDSFSSDVNWKRFYFAYFGVIPNSISLRNINLNKATKWVDSNRAGTILKKFTSEHVDQKAKESVDDVAYLMTDQLIFYFQNRNSTVDVYYPESPDKIHDLINSLLNFREHLSNSVISIVVVSEMHGLQLKPLNVKRPSCSLQSNYNDDLLGLHSSVLRALRKKNSSGLSLFHGAPGTGKSTYIRYLIGYVNKKVIFLPPRLAGNMDDPQMINLLTENPGTIIIIEDAEDLLVSRESASNSGISMLLNLTDGLLGSSLGIQFICTFNTHVSNIDKALLRKGRLTVLYEFKPLSEAKSKKLLKDLEVIDFEPTEPMTLAELYGIKTQGFGYERKLKAIGFTSKVA